MTFRVALHAFKVTAAVAALLYAIAHSPSPEAPATAPALERRPIALLGTGPP